MVDLPGELFYNAFLRPGHIQELRQLFRLRLVFTVCGFILLAFSIASENETAQFITFFISIFAIITHWPGGGPRGSMPWFGPISWGVWCDVTQQWSGPMLGVFAAAILLSALSGWRRWKIFARMIVLGASFLGVAEWVFRLRNC